MRLCLAACLCSLVVQTAVLQTAAAAADPLLSLKKGDRIVFIGNTLAERMLYDGGLETEIYRRNPQLDLVIRNLGWSADELTLRPRSKDFQDHGFELNDQKPSVLFAFFGFNESFGGDKGLPKFEADLKKFISDTTSTKYNGVAPPTLVLFSPIANEDLIDRKILAGANNNGNIRKYCDAMEKIAAETKTRFVDLFTPTLTMFDEAKTPLTINGCHLTAKGDELLARAIADALFGAAAAGKAEDVAKIRQAVNEKNKLLFYDYRAVNGYYIYGGRKKPFGVDNFPAEFAKLRKMTEVRDGAIWAVAKGDTPKIDDSKTGDFVTTPSNFTKEIKITSPQESAQQFTVPEGFEVQLFASEVDFPELENPVQFAFDSRGRLWVTTMPSYPGYLPGETPDDRILILEDTNGDGKADKSTVFADKLHLPTGIELGDGGAYVGAQPNLLFLKDTNGDDKADVRTLVAHGFDSADSHHALHAFEWGPGGDLYFGEGTFHHTQIETPYGPTRLKDAGFFRYEPKTEKLDVFVSYGFANPWGINWDHWGQTFIADASGGANYFATAFSGSVDYPDKHPNMKQFLVKQWRPTCGCEFVSSRQFPDELQGNYLLNNCIGFQGTLNYKMSEEGSGFHADPVEPLLASSDPNFRPVDLQFAPDGTLYICDWFNPLVGHMQHSIRDPNRDHNHGRIWRVVYKNKPLLTPAKIDGASIASLIALLKEPEYRTRYRVRRELRGRPTADVVDALDAWAAGLDINNTEEAHHLLEALWVKQHHNAVDATLLGRLLNAPEPRVRAAAVRVLCYWRDSIPEVLKLLQARVNDEHPRVRLEAVRALSFFSVPEALDIAVESLVYDQDDSLEYTLKETMTTLEKRLKK
ncbi:Membrane bound L-sorbosone dehydrogenase [Caulifigura coniformis]|uniref:Membrane bound L-sorbosone dehydrogenase n=1 Tax=Caulifigura coniformis TaxID=2527983 RepID=A0A517SDT3_9PLAN|nr:PVC-type heme-binding CxxCH protein [Caulifigura coniformis]QDT54267.1 Membrane bound L-sorbosone dehydrogenase [Caulifigura coniformis]